MDLVRVSISEKNGEVRVIEGPNGWSVQFKQYLNIQEKKPRSMSMAFGGNYDGKNDISLLFDNVLIEKTLSICWSLLLSGSI